LLGAPGVARPAEIGGRRGGKIGYAGAREGRVADAATASWRSPLFQVRDTRVEHRELPWSSTSVSSPRSRQAYPVSRGSAVPAPRSR
jgi:hypothetical protein